MSGVLCPECGKTIQVRKNGTLRSHTGTVKEFPGSPWTIHCPASGTDPKAEAPDDRA